jgi:hypothetical protein
LILQSTPDLPRVTPQFPFVDARGVEWARADFLVRRSVVVEFDGLTKYRADQGSTPRQAQDIVIAEKYREDRIRRERKVVVRLVWRELDQPREVAGRVRWAVREASALGYGT